MIRSTREVESDTASEEEDSSGKHGEDAVSSRTKAAASPGVSPEKESHYGSRTTIFERPKVENVSTSIPQKRKINSIILGKNRKGREARQDTPTPPQSPTPKRAKPLAKSPTKSPPKGEDERPAAPKKPEERIFHLSGPKNYLLRDGPVTLNPFQNRHAPGGFAVRIMQKGEYVGLIGLGQESLCRKLLADGWNPELRYLGGGRSEVIMRAPQKSA